MNSQNSCMYSWHWYELTEQLSVVPTLIWTHRTVVCSPVSLSWGLANCSVRFLNNQKHIYIILKSSSKSKSTNDFKLCLFTCLPPPLPYPPSLLITFLSCARTCAHVFMCLCVHACVCVQMWCAQNVYNIIYDYIYILILFLGFNVCISVIL